MFFFNYTTTTEIYTLSLHDALPIWPRPRCRHSRNCRRSATAPPALRSRRSDRRDRKSTRLNSSHMSISYAVFCLKKKNKDIQQLLRYINYSDVAYVECSRVSYSLNT